MSNQYIYPSYQRGVVLFFALIALVVMSLAAVALIRSVDTNTLIAGNLSFKQSALVSSDRGAETALAWVNTTATANANDLNTNKLASGYFATFDELNLDDRAVLKSDATWNVNSVAATGSGITAGVENSTGNTIRYIVQRMCRDELPPTKDQCVMGEAEVGTGSKGVKSSTEAGAKINGSESPIYRVTVRVDGPKNTVSYSQTYAY